MRRKIVLKVNGFLSIPHFHEAPSRRDFVPEKTSLMHSKLLRNANLAQTAQLETTNSGSAFFLGRERIFLHVLNNGNTSKAREKLLMQPQNAFQLFTKLRRENFP
jgi:hypothetical protein